MSSNPKCACLTRLVALPARSRPFFPQFFLFSSFIPFVFSMVVSGGGRAVPLLQKCLGLHRLMIPSHLHIPLLSPAPPVRWGSFIRMPENSLNGLPLPLPSVPCFFSSCSPGSSLFPSFPPLRVHEGPFLALALSQKRKLFGGSPLPEPS